MRKRGLIKILKENYSIKTKYFGDYDFEVVKESKSFFVKVINISENHKITINSKLVWSIKKGKINGIKFSTVSSELLYFKDFNKYDNKIVVLSHKPYKILKALNESDILDISDEKVVNNIFITSDISELIEYMK